MLCILMEFLWCIPVLPLTTSLSYYLFQEAKATRERRVHTENVFSLLRPMTEVFMNLATQLTNDISSDRKQAQAQAQTDPKPTDYVSIPIPDDPVWDHTYNNVSWEQGNVITADADDDSETDSETDTDSDNAEPSSDGWGWKSWTVKTKND